MAATKQSSIFLLFAFVTLSSIINSSNAADCVGNGAISVYWGQGSDSKVEGTLQDACATGNYNIVIIDGLIVYDDGRTPTLNLENHCGTTEHPCSELQSQIEYCQGKNIRVFLSILQDQTAPTRGGYSNTVAEELADHLLKHYLSGKPGPLGSVSLDGIDLGDVSDSKHLKWDELVKAINASKTERRIYISASPQCVYPDALLGKAIETGHVDYIWVEFFFNNPDCIYSNGDATKLLSAWKTWTSKVPNSLIFLGLAASDKVDGYISPNDLKTKVLPTAKKASNYGGVMIWDRYNDKINDYSGKIKESVPKNCRCVCDETAWISFNGMRPGSLPLMGSI